MSKSKQIQPPGARKMSRLARDGMVNPISRDLISHLARVFYVPLIYSQCSHLNVLTVFPPYLQDGYSESLDSLQTRWFKN